MSKQGSGIRVRFRQGTQQQYKAITPDNYTFYYATDIDALYLGSTRLPNVYVRTTAEWNSSRNFIGESGVFYVYSDYQEEEYINSQGQKANRFIPGIKVGDGLAYLIDLPFINSSGSGGVSLADRQFWNNKISFPNDSRTYTVGTDENLVFTVD